MTSPESDGTDNSRGKIPLPGPVKGIAVDMKLWLVLLL